MKFSSTAVLFATLSSASAFVAPTARSGISSRRFVVSEPSKVEAEVKIAEKIDIEDKKEEAPASEAPKIKVEAKEVAPAPVVVEEETAAANGSLQPGRYDSIDYSITLPFFQKPTKLDGSHAGDYGFDPMGFTEEFDMYYLQECETRHARLAMLAVVGWPLSELIGPDFMLQSGCAPSVLNGVNPVSAVAILAFLGYVGTMEVGTWNRRTAGTKLGEVHREDMKNIWDTGVAGDYNFDPLDLYNKLGDDAMGRKAMRKLEVTQGRYAMLGITYFALYEALTGYPIVEDNPFFHPNALLPVAGIAYGVWSTLYEVSDLREYPIKIQKSKLGKEFDEWMERRNESS